MKAKKVIYEADFLVTWGSEPGFKMFFASSIAFGRVVGTSGRGTFDTCGKHVRPLFQGLVRYVFFERLEDV